MKEQNAISEWVEMLARLKPAQLLSYAPSSELLERVQELVYKNNAGTLTMEEEAELRSFESFENLFGLARARARQLVEAA